MLLLWYSYRENLGDFYLFNTVKEYAKEWGFDVIGMDVGLPYKQIAKAARNCSWIWFAGGGIIERGIPDIIRNFPAFYEDTHHISYGITGLSIGNFDYSKDAQALAFWATNASFFYTRDEYSANALNQIAQTSRIVSSADVVLANKRFDNYAPQNQPHFGVNFRTMPYPDITGEIDLAAWNDIICKSLASKPIGIPDQIDVSRHFSFAFGRPYSPQNAVATISRIDSGIAMRYHVILIAAMLGKVCIPVDYCPKVTRLAEQLGISELVLHYNEFEKFPAIIGKYQDDSEHYKETLKENVAIMAKKARLMFEAVAGITMEA